MSRGWAVVILVLGAYAACGAPAHADSDPAKTPFLRLDAGMHTAEINSLSVDGSGALVATASDDKTVRLWHESDGSLIATLRVPIETGAEGALNAVALAPDGKHILAGGATGFSWGPGFALYLFDVAKQAMIGRLAGLPDAVMDVAYAPGGGAFAVGFAKQGGIRLYDASGKQIAEDKSYGERVSAIAFDAHNRFAVSAYDGKVRLYDPAGKLVASVTAPGGARPSSVAFSPDGNWLAVGYDDAARVDVLSGADLSPHLADTATDLGDGALSAVGWSGEGNAATLYAAGRAHTKDNAVVVRRWADSGAAKPVDVAVGRDLVTRLVALPAGGMAFATADPAWGVIAANGQVGYRHGPVTNDFRVMSERRFDVAADGLTLDFAPAAPGNPIYRFDLRDRSLKRLTAAEAGARRFAPKTAPAPIQGLNTSSPTVAGQKITLPALELARSAVVLPDRILVGTDYFIRSYDRSGREIAPPHAAPGAVWSLAAAATGKLVVAALGDGTIRWYGIPSGSGNALDLLASMFSHVDGRRWVMWTAEGFFDHADTGGKELVGYQLNRGKADAPDWIGFAQLYNAYYAPDLVLAKLTGTNAGAIRQRLATIGDARTWLQTGGLPKVDIEAYCVAADSGPESCTPISLGTTMKIAPAAGANADAPRYVNVVFPPGTGKISLRYRVVDQGGGIGPIDLFENDRNAGRQSAAEAARGLKPVGGGGASEGERSFTLDKGVSRIELRVYDRTAQAYAVSNDLSLFAPTTPSAGTNATNPALPRLFILSVGIDKYTPPAPALNLAVSDAKSFVAAVRQGTKPLYREVDAEELYDDRATVAGIDKAMDDIAAQATADDMLLVYFAGHGEQIDREYYFIPQDFVMPPDDASDADIDKAIATQGLSGEDLVAHLGKIGAKDGFLFLDTCHAGAIHLDTGPARINQESGRYILVASQSIQSAADSYNGKNGIFAYAVLEGLEGKARRDASQPVDNMDLGFYVRDRVPELAKQLAYDQSSSFKISAEDAVRFPIVKPP